MWSTDYIQEIQRQLISEYGFEESPTRPGVPLGPVPDGEYPMTIEGKLDKVRIKRGFINCCNFDEEPAAATP